MTRLSMVVDLERCVGCMSCVVACKMENDVPVGINLNKVEQVGPVGEWPYGLSQYFLPHACMHCAKPLCVAACPTGASTVREDGLVLIDSELCLQCDTCVTACPYDARAIDAQKATAVKCTMCVDLIDAGEKPSCVKHCMGEARFFGDLDDPNSDINKYLEENDNKSRIVYLLEGEGTEPAVMYLEPKCGMLADQVTDIDVLK